MAQLRSREEDEQDDYTQKELIEWYQGERDDIDSEEELQLAGKKVGTAAYHPLECTQ